jgi:spore coat protein CotH
LLSIVWTGSLLLWAGCGSSGATPVKASASHGSAASSAQSKAAGAGQSKAATAAPAPPLDVFDPNVVRNYALTVDPADWDLITRFPVKEQYVKASLQIEGRTFSPVALRFKGARGSLYGCFKCCSTSSTLDQCPGPDQACYDDNGMVAKSTCAKLSMKIDFKNQWGTTDFSGVELLNVHAPQFDGTAGLRERLAYWIFAEAGVVGPRTASASVSVNGQNLGMFTLVEAESGSFVKNAFGDADPGNLYKQRWPTLSTDPDYFTSGLATNGKSPDVSKMVELAQALSTASDDTIEGILSERMDLDSLFRYLAVDRAIGNFDGPLTFRCKDHNTIIALPDDVLEPQLFPLPWETCQNKNYYFYERPDDHRMVLVPWDLNLTLLPFSFMADWTAAPVACDKMQWDGRSPQCDPLVRWLATTMYPRYLDAATQVASGAFDLDRMNAQLDDWAASVRPVATKLEPGLSQPQFDGSLQMLKGVLKTLHDAFVKSIGQSP